MTCGRRSFALGVAGLAAGGCAQERWSDTHVEAPGHAKSWDDTPTERTLAPAFAPATANEVMMREHGLLERLLLVYEETGLRLGGAGPLEVSFEGEPGFVTVGGIISAAGRMIRRVIEDGHFRVEERLVFARMREDGIERLLVDELVTQHRGARALTSSILSHVETRGASEGDAELADMLAGYARLSRAHASREETLVYPASRVTLGEEAYALLSDQLARASAFSQSTWVETEAELFAMESALGIHDLERYSPPKPGSAQNTLSTGSPSAMAPAYSSWGPARSGW